jgi:hypothetical protein
MSVLRSLTLPDASIKSAWIGQNDVQPTYSKTDTMLFSQVITGLGACGTRLALLHREMG